MNPQQLTASRMCSADADCLNLRLEISPTHRRDPILSHLSRLYGLEVVILAAQLHLHQWGWIDIELRGNLEQIKLGVCHLEKQEIIITGKPAQASDSWGY